MADNKRPSYTKVMTEEGVLVFPNLTTPDRKFAKNGVGSYTARIRLEGAAAQSLIDKIDAEMPKALEAAKAELTRKLEEAQASTKADKGKKIAAAKKELAELRQADPPYKAAVDDDGNETGSYEFNFKMPESYTKDKGKPSEKQVPIKPDMFDARGKPMKAVPNVWGGTVACVAGELRPFYTALAGAGVSLRLRAVQIITLRSEGSGSRDAADYGFGARADGYEASDDEAPEGGFEDRSGGSEGGSGDAGPEDF